MPVPGLAGVTSVAAGHGHSVALTNGEVYTWGWNMLGQLGDGSTTDRITPVKVPGIAGATAIAAGQGHSLAITAGTVHAWGSNNVGQLGDGATASHRATPGAVAGTTGATAIAGGSIHSLALIGGTVHGWGGNWFGQLGDGTTTSRLTPTPVPGTAGSTSVAAGDVHSVAVAGSRALSWGRNVSGQLGDGTTTDRTTPVAVAGIAGAAIAVDAGDHHSIASVAGQVMTWGSNSAGQLGDGTTVSSTTAQLVPGLAGSTAVAAGMGHSLAVVGGTVWGWGSNDSGQLGDGTTTSRSVPSTISCLHPPAPPLPSPSLPPTPSPSLPPTPSPSIPETPEVTPPPLDPTILPGPTYASDECAAASVNVLTGFVGDAYVKARYRPSTSVTDPSFVCVAMEASGIHLGGRVRIDNASPAIPVGMDSDGPSVAACAGEPTNVRVQSGTVLGGQLYWIDVAPNAGADDDTWVCVRFTNSIGMRLRIRAVDVSAVPQFTPDPTALHTPAYAEQQWPVTAASAACAASGKRYLNVALGDTPIGLYSWQETSARTHLCVRAGSNGGAGGRLTVDTAASPGVTPLVTTGDTINPCPFDLVTRTDAPTYGVYLSDPAGLPNAPVSACVAVTSFAFSVSLGADEAATASWTADET